MSWVSVFASFLVAHMVGDYLFQTDWQARNKRGGLSGGVALRALATHVTTYTLAFLPALVWIGDVLDPGWGVLAAALIFLPHFVLDDGRIVRAHLTHVKLRVEVLNLLLNDRGNFVAIEFHGRVVSK